MHSIVIRLRHRTGRKKGCTGSECDGDDPSRCSLTLIHHFLHMAVAVMGL